jgi:hypothetical protein
MHTRSGIAAVAAGLLLAAPVWAQHTVTFGGADPTHIINQPITIPSGGPIAVPQQLGSTGFSLANLFPHISLPAPFAIFGKSTFPTAANMPGRDYLKFFGYQKGVPVSP